MATVTVNVDDEIEARFRECAFATHGKKKGALSKAFNEAMLQWSARQKHYAVTMKLLEEGIDLGGFQYRSRDELHDRH